MAMTPPDDLGSILSIFQNCFNSIDLRTVAVKPTKEPSWINLATSVFFSEKSVEEVEIEQTKKPTIYNNQFAIFYKALPFDISTIEQMSNGQVVFNNGSVENIVKARKIDILKLRLSSEHIPAKDGFSLSANTSGGQQERQDLWPVVYNQRLEAKRQNYEEIDELIRDALGIEYRNGEQLDFKFNMPSFACIEEISFEEDLTVKIKRPNQIPGIQMNLVLKRYDGNFSSPVIWKKRVDVTRGKRGVKKYKFHLNNALPFDNLSIDLFLKDSGISLASASFSIPLKNVSDPLIKTFNSFCSIEDYKSMLFNPYSFRQPEEAFENAAMWLFAMMDLSPLHLDLRLKSVNGKTKSFDVLRHMNSVTVGCADILAYSENKSILLIDCDTGSIDDKKIQQLSDTQKYFKLNYPELKHINFIPILMSPKDAYGAEAQGDVRIIGKFSIERMFEYIAKGEKAKARLEIDWSLK